MSKQITPEDKKFNKTLSILTSSGILITMLSLPVYGVIAKYAWSKIESNEKKVYELEKKQAVQDEINKRLIRIENKIDDLTKTK